MYFLIYFSSIVILSVVVVSVPLPNRLIPLHQNTLRERR